MKYYYNPEGHISFSLVKLDPLLIPIINILLELKCFLHYSNPTTPKLTLTLPLSSWLAISTDSLAPKKKTVLPST